MNNSETSQKAKQQRQILTEEEYTSTLSSIITRDYYPSLTSLRRDVAILQHRKQGDVRGAVTLRRAHREIAEREEAEKEQEQLEEQEAIENGGIRKRPRPLHRESIMGFHARVTSEDNEDFEQEMRKEVREKKERMDIIYNTTGSKAKDVQNLLLTYHETGSESNKSTQDKILPLISSNTSNELVNAQCTSDRESMPPPITLLPHQSKHTSTPSGSNQISTLTTSSSTAITTSNSTPLPRSELVEYIPKKTSMPNHKEKEVVSSNTRFTYQKESRLVPLHQSHSTSQPLSSNDAIHYQSDSTTDLDAPLNPIHIEREARTAKMNQERESYVTMTPLIIPGRDSGGTSPSRDDGSPIVTWGEVATPLISGTNHDSLEPDSMGEDGPTFVLPQKDSREQTARIAESIVVQEIRKVKGKRKHIQESSSNSVGASSATSVRDMKKREKLKRKPSSVRSSSTLLDRAQSLTPAARSLMERKSKSQSSRLSSTPLFSPKVSARSSSSLGSVLRSSYTPQHASKRRDGKMRQCSSSRKQKLVDVPTPRSSLKNHDVSSSSASTQNISTIKIDVSSADLTGGLLK